MDEKNELKQDSNILNTPESQVPNIKIPALRTLKDDVSQTVQKDKITTAKILIAEQQRKQLEEKKKSDEVVEKTGNIFATLFGLVFLVASIGLIGYFGYSKINTPAPVTNTISQDSSFLFVFEKERIIDVSDADRTKIDSLISQYSIEATQSPLNTYTEIIFSKRDSITQVVSRISTVEFFRLFEIPTTTNLIQSLSSDFVYALINIDNRAERFWVIGIIDYESTYNNFFSWERTMALDLRNVFPVLKDLFDISKIIGLNEANTSSSDSSVVQTSDLDTPESQDLTPPTEIPEQNLVEQDMVQNNFITIESINKNLRFTDLVLSNYNTRAMRNENGTPFFYYAFLGKDKVLFAENPKVIAEVVKKMRQKQLIR
jgi:hypothetical protein